MNLKFNEIKNYYTEKFFEYIMQWVKHNSPDISSRVYVIQSFQDGDYHIFDEYCVSEIVATVERRFKYHDLLYAYSSESVFIRKQIKNFLNDHIGDWLQYVI